MDGARGQIILNRPQYHNAINRQMWKELPGVLRDLQNNGARAVVISGFGDSFAAGADLNELAQLQDYAQAEEYWSSIKDCLDFLATFATITIAKISGACLGGGCLLSIACDLRYASTNSSFGIPIARLGIVLDDGNISRLIELVGRAAAAELLFTGATISGEKAEKLGLINGLLNPAELENQVHFVVSQILDNVSVSLGQTKASLQRLAVATAQIQLSQNQREIIDSYLNDEFKGRIKRS